MTDKTPHYASSGGNCENIKQIRGAVKAVNRFKPIDIEPKSQILESLFKEYVREMNS